MAENRNQYERLHKINERLNRWRGARVVTKEELLDLTGYSERTLKEDLKYLREAYQAPLQYDYRQRGYRYTAPFDLQVELVLSDRDLRNLYGAVQTLTQFKEMGLFDDLRSTVEKIEKAVHFRAGRLPAQALLFEEVPYFRGSQLIEIFLEAIQKQRAVHFLHQKFENGQPERYLVEPYVVKEHRNRWYLVGLARNRRGIRCFGLDRVLPDSVQLVEEEPVESTFDAEAYFRQALGIAVYDQPA
ncbi:hypothetical protein GCM10027275_10900 [Rhabdobacter roseus]|uniref:Putative DNA-binding transcriptional regulator YafY n=1 Tax=Rhabdobacter roseus TaxID=1655419 RepID=A0A840TTI8_9BACT|nr:WYL domain-containing protein [Rhabdobacter roseus]MBB5282999.1 putative DNA-binding transcriptional regulator YafY [Rhabdobacter roseus]